MPTINNPRVYLWAALAALVFLDYQSWLHDYSELGPSSAPTAAAGHGTAPATDLSTQVPRAPAAASPGAPSSAATSAEAASSGAPSSAAAPAGTSGPSEALAPAAAPVAAPLVRVRTDVLDLEISTRGGTLQRADLLAYPLVKGQPAPVQLENDDSPQTLYELESGLVGAGSASYPTHLATFESTRSDYEMGGAVELRVPLTWTGADGVTVTKTYVFRRGDYRIDLDYQVHNGGSAPWGASPYTQILRNDPRTKTSYFNVASYAFHGPALWDGDKYRKLNPTDAQDSHLTLEVTNGWIAALQHHFVSAIVPPRGAPYRFTLQVAGDRYLLAATGPGQTIAPGATGEFTQTLFVGPKLQAQLEATAPELGRVADYGRLWFLARPLFLALSFVHRLSGNWGVAIIFVTFLLKLLFYPLSEASGRSMAKMKALGPRIKNLQETYADDREKLGRAMMELYKREKVNPVAGCLPIVIQIPVFLAFYWVLLESVEMRQAPFALWIHDLSSRDPYFILPAIMAVAMFVQYKLNPAPPDPVQAKMFMIMPLVMSATFAFFPAGLVLYWVTNTILSIAQQWNINRRIAAAMAAKKS
jgi:YidC/Oxa1 family membrane protein insertase